MEKKDFDVASASAIHCAPSMLGKAGKASSCTVQWENLFSYLSFSNLFVFLKCKQLDLKKTSKKIDFPTELCTRRLYRLYRALKGHSGWRSHRLHQNPFSPYQKVFFLLRTTTFAFCPKSSTDFTLHCIARFPAANSRSKLLSNVGRSLLNWTKEYKTGGQTIPASQTRFNFKVQYY